MAWKCPQCGFQHATDSLRCEACGFTRGGGGRLVLVAEATHQRLTVGVDTAIGKRLLLTFAGEDHVYAAEPQFLLVRDPAEGWTIAPVPGTTNPTFVNGAALGDSPVPLAPGAVISIGPSRMRLRVENEP